MIDYIDHVSVSDNIPILSCAPNQAIAECMECILQAMLGQKEIPL